MDCHDVETDGETMTRTEHCKNYKAKPEKGFVILCAFAGLTMLASSSKGVANGSTGSPGDCTCIFVRSREVDLVDSCRLMPTNGGVTGTGTGTVDERLCLSCEGAASEILARNVG